MNTATDERASARIRFLWIMGHLLCGSALEWAILFGFHAHREPLVTGLAGSSRLLLPKQRAVQLPHALPPSPFGESCGALTLQGGLRGTSPTRDIVLFHVATAELSIA